MEKRNNGARIVCIQQPYDLFYRFRSDRRERYSSHQ